MWLLFKKSRVISTIHASKQFINFNNIVCCCLTKLVLEFEASIFTHPDEEESVNDQLDDVINFTLAKIVILCGNACSKFEPPLL